MTVAYRVGRGVCFGSLRKESWWSADSTSQQHNSHNVRHYAGSVKRKGICFSLLSSQSQVMSLSRFVVIDDTNPSIQYSGPWFEVNNTQVDTGIMGPPFQNTLHGVNVTANFSFPFSGKSCLLYWYAFDPSHYLSFQDQQLLFTGQV